MTDTIAALFDRPAWLERAACRGIDPNLFHPGPGEDTKPAKAVCAHCSVTAECLDYAMTHGLTVGVWGGTSQNERRKMRREWAAEHDIDLRGLAQRKPIDHGTSAGARRCYERPEGACWACRDWWSRNREYRSVGRDGGAA